MTSLTRDICPSCGAWLTLVEVIYVREEVRRYPDTGCLVVYECPSCAGVYETWAHDADPLVEMTSENRDIRARMAAKRPAPPD
jgi:uncharacterized protein with PIN domain